MITDLRKVKPEDITEQDLIPIAIFEDLPYEADRGFALMGLKMGMSVEEVEPFIKGWESRPQWYKEQYG